VTSRGKVLAICVVLTAGCYGGNDYPTYLQAVDSAKGKVGTTIVVNKGQWAGCHLKVERVGAEEDFCHLTSVCEYPVYYGSSPDCPIKGTDDRGDVWLR
jgi:hypothetical protein